jgi:hypothetical protein
VASAAVSKSVTGDSLVSQTPKYVLRRLLEYLLELKLDSVDDTVWEQMQFPDVHTNEQNLPSVVVAAARSQPS